MKADLLDAQVWQRVVNALADEDLIASQLARLETTDPTEAELRAVDRALTDVSRRQAKLARALSSLDDPDVTDPILAELKTLGVRKRILEAERVNVLARRDAWLLARDRVQNLRVWCRAVADRLRTANYEMKRLALEALAVEVRLYHADHDPRYDIKAAIPLDADPSDPILSATASSSEKSPSGCLARP